MTIDDAAAFARDTGIYDFMNSSWGWPAVESLHYLAIALLLGTVGLFDLRLLGFVRGLPLQALHRIVPLGVAAYLVSILTGSLFFVSAPDQYAYNPAFQLKLGCMVIAGVNVAVFYVSALAKVQAGDAHAVPRWPVKVLAAISLASWLGVIVFGRLITYFRPPYQWCWWCS